MKAVSNTFSKQRVASYQRLVACVAICLLFVAFLVVCFAGKPGLGTLALFAALVSGVAKVAVEFFKCVRG